MSTPLPLKIFREFLNSEKHILVDLRHQKEFVKKYVKSSLFVGIDGPFEKWMQLVVPNKESSLLLILPKNNENICLTKLHDLGYLNIIGFLEGGFSAWEKHYLFETIESISPKLYIEQYHQEKIESIDVRKTYNI